MSLVPPPHPWVPCYFMSLTLPHPWLPCSERDSKTYDSCKRPKRLVKCLPLSMKKVMLGNKGHHILFTSGDA